MAPHEKITEKAPWIKTYVLVIGAILSTLGLVTAMSQMGMCSRGWASKDEIQEVKDSSSVARQSIRGEVKELEAKHREDVAQIRQQIESVKENTDKILDALPKSWKTRRHPR